MNTLIVCDVYPPEVSSAAHLMQELAEALKKRGKNVWVVTSYPRHYLPKDFQKRYFDEVSDEKGIKVIRVKTPPLHKVNFIARGIAQLLLPYLFFSKIKKLIREKIDAVVIYSPPLPLALVGGKVKKKYGAEFVLNVQDIFPQNAIDLGVLRGWKHKPAAWLFEVIEKRAYRSADRITFHSEGGRRFLIKEKGVPEDKIKVVYNWIDFGAYRNLTENISFRKKWSLEGKFIFLFAGIMGPAQGISFIIEVAKRVADIKDINFLLVGDGMEREKSEKMAKEYNFKNILFKPFVSKKEYPYLVKDIDVGLVCLSPQNKTSFIPGKFLGYMAAGKPIVAFLNKESDGFAVIREAGCGYAVRSDELEKAVEVIRKAYKEKSDLDKLGKNGFTYASENFTIQKALERMGLK